MSTANKKPTNDGMLPIDRRLLTVLRSLGYPAEIFCRQRTPSLLQMRATVFHHMAARDPATGAVYSQSEIAKACGVSRWQVMHALQHRRPLRPVPTTQEDAA